MWHRCRTGVLLAAALLSGSARPAGPSSHARSSGGQHGPAESIWHIAGEGRGRPLVDGETVYFLSRRHAVLAVGAASGALRWASKTAEPGEATMGTSIVATGTVIVAGDYNLVAFARETGAFRWRFAPSDGYGPGIYLGAAAGDLILAGSPAGRLYAVDAESGVQRWSTVVADTPATVFQPILDRDQVVAAYTTFSVPNGGGVAAYDRDTGALKWRTPFRGSNGSGSPAAAAGGLATVDRLVLAPSSEGVIYALDRDTGLIRWSLPGITPATGRDFRPLTVTGRTLVAGSLTGCTVSYDLRTREERWRYCDPAGASVAFAISSDERSVYAPYYEGRLVALDAGSGKERWHLGGGPDTGFNWLPAADGDRLYVAASTAGFFGLRRP